MAIQILKLWQVHLWDGGSMHRASLYHFTNKAAADEFLSANRYEYIQAVELTVMDSYEDYKVATTASAREAALAKLSPAERQLLGLK